MEKNWLIRTKSKQILGPVSKTKIREFVDKGSLTGDDELSSGNGYWFWVREKNLVEKYVLGDVPQTFNPISEACDVLTAGESAPHDTASHARIPSHPGSEIGEPEEPVKFPSQSDLEYPDSDSSAETEASDLTLVMEGSALSLDIPATDSALAAEEELGLEEETEVDNKQDENDFGPLETLETVESESLPESLPDIEEEPDEEPEPVPASSKKKKKKKKKVKKRSRVVQAPARNDRYLLYILVLLFLIVAGVLYYFTKVLNRPIPLVGEVSLFPSAYAQQGETSLSKKKV